MKEEPLNPSQASTPTEYISLPPSPVANRSAQLFDRIRSTTQSVFPRERRSFITDTTTASRKRAIISIAIRKGLFVFFSVHGVVSTALFALALVRGKGVKLNSYSAHSPGQKRAGSRLIEVLLQTIRSSSTARLATQYSPLESVYCGLFMWVSFFAQPRADRKEIAPNVLCRGIYSVLMCYPLFQFKYADMLLFALSNAQIAVGYLLYPNSLPGWYVHWVSRVGELNPRYVELNRGLDRSLINPLELMTKERHHRLIYRDTQPGLGLMNFVFNLGLISPIQSIAKVLLALLITSIMIAVFVLIWLNSLKLSSKWLLPMLFYISYLHSSFSNEFYELDHKENYIKCIIYRTFVSVVQNCFCLPSQLYERFGIIIKGSPFYALMGFLTGVSLFWEEPKRRGELALYCAPKGLYSLWTVLKAKKWVPRGEIIMGDIIVSSIGCGMLMHCFVNRKEHMPALARGIISQIVDPHTPDRTKKTKAIVIPDQHRNSRINLDDQNVLSTGVLRTLDDQDLSSPQPSPSPVSS
ncbi:hypothetical protein PSTT_09351 [Puccinia striiformis]|uniref:Uncharacterized protein n=1 Tax=Puccinia striiformis TaxID=27350 RepID=A0A2S4V8Z5_9BASI|nr:hypothetical protein PSTT_09351 [Puccinia striiformis]